MIKMIQQQVEEIRFEQVYIDKLILKATKTHKIRDWLALLNAYEENNQAAEKQAAIHKMHSMFILNEDFWVKQIHRKLAQQHLTQQDISFMFMAFDDGYYFTAGAIVYKRLIQELKKTEKSAGELRPNFIIAKVEKIFNLLSYKENYYPDLREYYKQANNQRKVRELYIRQIRAAYSTVDIAYDEYKNWEKDEQKLRQIEPIYQQAKSTYLLGGKMAIHTMLSDIHSNNFDSVRCYRLLQNLGTSVDRLWHLRRISLGRREMVIEYLEEFEAAHLYDQDLVIETYKNALIFSPEAEMAYLQFLVRRINKHIQQKQEEQYNESWGEKVKFFRNQIASLIAKPRLTPKTEESIRETYYNFWIDVETALIHDSDSIREIFQRFLLFKQTLNAYSKYSECMIKLGNIADAKQILKRCCKAFKYEFLAQKQYENFIAIYGTINDFIELRKTRNLQRDQRKDQLKSIQPSPTQVKIIQPLILEEPKETKFLVVEEKDEVDLQPMKRERPQEDHDDFVNKSEKNEVLRKKMHADGGNTLFIKGIPSSWQKEDVREIIKNADKIQEIRLIEKNGVRKNYCYVDMQSSKDAELQVKSHEPTEKYQIYLSKPPTAFNEDKTLFLCALPQSATVEKIKNLFGDYSSSVVDVRLKLDQQKNIAYVDFDAEENYEKAFNALSKQKLSIDGKIVLLQKSNTHRLQQNKKENNAAILKSLSFQATEEDIRNFFQQLPIEEVVIPQENGKSKGFAFVKFKDRRSLNDALSIRNGSIKGRRFEIQKSSREVQKPKTAGGSGAVTENRTNDYFSSIFK